MSAVKPKRPAKQSDKQIRIGFSRDASGESRSQTEGRRRRDGLCEPDLEDETTVDCRFYASPLGAGAFASISALLRWKSHRRRSFERQRNA
jgi:hypothetical protein